MGRWCWMCRRERANERFTGKGHRQGICRDCTRLPIEERARISALNDLLGYLEQSNISPRNLARTAELARSPAPDVARLAEVVGEIGRAHPRRKKRIGRIRHHHPELFARMVELGLASDEPPEDWLALEPDWPEAQPGELVGLWADAQEVSPAGTHDLDDMVDWTDPWVC